MPTPKTSHLIGIKIYNINSQLLDGATVTLTLGTEVLTQTSNSDGEAIFNAANFSSWSVNDEVTATASKTSEGTKTETIVLTSAGGQKSTITLAQTSDLAFLNPEVDNAYPLTFALLTDYSGEKITESNPLSVSAETLLNEPAMAVTYDTSNRLSTQTITVKGVEYKRTFTYTGTGFQFTARTAWIKQ